MIAQRLNRILKHTTWGDGNFLDFIPSQKLKMAPENLVKVRATSCFWGYFWISNGCRKFSRCRNTMMWVFKIIPRCRPLRRIKNRVHMTLRSKNIYAFLKIGYKKKIFPPHHCNTIWISFDSTRGELKIDCKTPQNAFLVSEIAKIHSKQSRTH